MSMLSIALLSVIWRSIIFECPAIYVFYVAPMLPRDSETSEIIFSHLQFNELDPNIARWSTVVSSFRFQPRVNVFVSSMLLDARLSDHRVAYYRFRRPAYYRVDRYQERVSSQTDKPHVSRKNCSCRARKHSLTHARFVPGKFNELFHGLHAPLLVHFLFCLRIAFTKKVALHAIIFGVAEGWRHLDGVVTEDPKNFNLQHCLKFDSFSKGFHKNTSDTLHTRFNCNYMRLKISEIRMSTLILCRTNSSYLYYAYLISYNVHNQSIID